MYFNILTGVTDMIAEPKATDNCSGTVLLPRLSFLSACDLAWTNRDTDGPYSGFISILTANSWIK